MRLGSLIKCSGEAAQTSHKLNVKGPGSKVNHRDSAFGTLMTHAQRKDTARNNREDFIFTHPPGAGVGMSPHRIGKEIGIFFPKN